MTHRLPLRLFWSSACVLALVAGHAWGMNALEEALNPFGSSRQTLQAFRKQGDPQPPQGWHGLRVLSYTTEFDRTGLLKSVVVQVDPATPVEKLQTAARQACGDDNLLWRTDRFDRGRKFSGKAESVRCIAIYDNFVNGAGKLSLMIARK